MKENSLSWEWQTDKNTFDNVNVSHFKNTRFSTLMSLILRILSVILTIVFYASDCYTCVKLLAYNSWGSEIQPTIPFSISRWIFSGCIVLSIILLIYEWIYALRIYRSKNISLTYTNTIARNLWSCKGYSYFCLYDQITPGDFFDYCSFMVYFTLKGCIKLIFAESPRQVINGITIISTIQYSGGSIVTNYKDFTSDNNRQSWALVFSVMALSFVIWVIFMVKFMIALLASTCVISKINIRGYNLKQYVCIRINDKVSELSKSYHVKAIARKESAMTFSTKNSSPVLPSPSLPDEFYSINDKSAQKKPSISSFNSPSQKFASPIYNNVGNRKPSGQNLRRVPYNPNYNISDLTIDNNTTARRIPPPKNDLAQNLLNDGSQELAASDNTRGNNNSSRSDYRPPAAPSLIRTNQERKHPLANNFNNNNDNLENIELKSYPTFSSFSSGPHDKQYIPNYVSSSPDTVLENPFQRMDTGNANQFQTYNNNDSQTTGGSFPWQASVSANNILDCDKYSLTTPVGNTQSPFVPAPLTSTSTMLSIQPDSRANTGSVQADINRNGTKTGTSLPYPKDPMSPLVTSSPMSSMNSLKTPEISTAPYVARVSTLPYTSGSTGTIPGIQKSSTFSANYSGAEIDSNTTMYSPRAPNRGTNYNYGSPRTPYNVVQATGSLNVDTNLQFSQTGSLMSSSVSGSSPQPLLSRSKAEDDVSPYTNTGRWDTFEDVFDTPNKLSR